MCIIITVYWDLGYLVEVGVVHDWNRRLRTCDRARERNRPARAAEPSGKLI